MFKELIDLEYSVQVNCENSTYVSKSHSNTNYSQDNSLIVGLLKEQDNKTNASISLLSFPTLNLESNDINHAYLYLFLEDIKTVNNKSAKLNIIGDFEYINIEKVSWNNFFGGSLSNKTIIEISISEINSYIKIDVKDIIRNLAKFDINYNLLISPVTPSTSTFIKFSSCKSNNPPYLVLDKLDDDYSNLNSENTYDNTTTSNYDNYYDNSNTLSDEHTYNEKNDNYEVTNDIIDDINLNKEANINTSDNIDVKNNKYSTDSHINIDFDSDYNDSNDFPPLNDNFNELIGKLDTLSNILITSINNVDEKLSKWDTQFINYSNLINDLSNMIKNMNNKIDNQKKDAENSDDKISKLFDIVDKNAPSLDFGNILSIMDTIKDTFGTPKAKTVIDKNNKTDDFSNIAKHISHKINVINDKEDSSDKKMEDSFQELSNSILNAINKNISLLNKEINDSKNEVSDNE